MGSFEDFREVMSGRFITLKYDVVNSSLNCMPLFLSVNYKLLLSLEDLKVFLWLYWILFRIIFGVFSQLQYFSITISMINIDKFI